MNEQSFFAEIDSASRELVAECKSYSEGARSRGMASTASNKAAHIALRQQSVPYLSKFLGVDPSYFVQGSSADEGILGTLNQRAREKRDKRFERNSAKRPHATRIISEGDSWFQYPVYVKDIIDWLIKKPQFVVKSLGAGGDWLLNIVQNPEYLNEIENISRASSSPVFFLISGGGNDLMQNERIIKLIKDEKDLPEKPTAEDYIHPNFDNLLKLFSFLYCMLFTEIKSRFPNVHILCHGYDIPYPTSSLGPGFVPFLMHALFGNGTWLNKPMRKIGIKDPELQREIISIMLNKFNNMQEENSQEFDHVHYLDLRGMAKEPNDWHDEIHPNSKNFKEMANKYEAYMQSITDLVAD